MTPPDIFALLLRIVDGEQTKVTADEAKAIHALCWDAKSAADQANRARVRAAELDRENVALVAQVLAFERRMAVQALALASAVERAAELDRENVALVAQVLAFERRVAVQALALASAVELLRAHDGDQRRYNPRGYRNAVRDFLSTLPGSTG